MNSLKGLGTGILSFFLFLSLSVFSIAFLLHTTALQPDFVVTQVNKLDMSSLAKETFDEYISEEMPPEADFLKDAAYDIIAEYEPWLKDQLDYSIHAGYDFLLSNSEQLEITIPLETLKADLKESLWEALNQRIADWFPEIAEEELSPYISEHIHEYAQSIPEEYLPPDVSSQSDELIERYLQQHIQEIDTAIMSGSVPDISGLTEALIKPYYDDYYEDYFASQIPSEILVNEDEVSADTMENLLMARKYIGYFQTWYYALIAFMVVLVAGIVLINRNVRVITRTLGMNLLIYGALEFAAIVFIRSLDMAGYIPELPYSLETWLNGLFKDFLAPLYWLSLGILIAGVILLIVSFVYRPRIIEEPEEKQS
jgi:hypothetical protein